MKADDKYLSLVRPWVADEVMLTDEQRARVLVRVREFQAAMRVAASSYPIGGQDAEGTRERSRIEKSISETQERIEAELKGLLTANQVELFSRLKPVAVAGTVKLETRRSFAALLWPVEIDTLKLSEGQRARLNALLEQGVEDWITGDGDPDARLQSLRQRVLKDFRDILRPEQLSLLTKNEAPRTTAMILLGRSHYDLFGHAARKRMAPAKTNDSRSSPTSLSMTLVNELTSMVQVKRESGQPIPHVLWHKETDRILAAARSPDGRFIVTASSSVPGIASDQEFRLWDANTGALLAIGGAGGRGASTSRSATIQFLSSECVLYQVSPYGR